MNCLLVQTCCRGITAVLLVLRVIGDWEEILHTNCVTNIFAGYAHTSLPRAPSVLGGQARSGSKKVLGVRGLEPLNLLRAKLSPITKASTLLAILPSGRGNHTKQWTHDGAGLPDDHPRFDKHIARALLYTAATAPPLPSCGRYVLLAPHSVMILCALRFTMPRERRRGRRRGERGRRRKWG